MAHIIKRKSSGLEAAHNLQTRSKAFGRFGMRIFVPTIMDHPHTHGHVEANYILNGRLHYIVDGERVVVEPDTLIIFWANVPHQLITVEKTSGVEPELSNMYLPVDTFLFMPHIQDLQIKVLNGAMVVVPSALYSRDLIQRWYEDYRTHNSERMEIMAMELNALFRRVSLSPLAFLRQPWQKSTTKSDTPSVHIRNVVEMVRFILENLTLPLTNAKIAKVAGLHSNYALLLFTKTMMISPKQFIIRMRLLRARSILLEGDTPITTVALDCGFNSMSQFYQHFSVAYGTTPQALRKKSSPRKLRF